MLRIHNPKGTIILGNNIRINSAEWDNPIGYIGKTNFKIISTGCIEIGDDVGLSCASVVANTRITVGNRMLIGAGVMILKGVHIGGNVVIGANSLITKDLLCDGIYAGSPANLIRKL